jgi:molecular chaperone HtpG
LYSDHEIFIRELISNAVDATNKLKTLASIGEYKDEVGNIDIELLLDTEKKTITIRDRGIGMTAEEVDKYLNQVAFSSAEEFLSKYKGQAESASVIGHFGLGFYSSFMVSSKVDVITKSYKGSPASMWSCDGSPSFTLTEADKQERGTDIVMHINEESEEF